MLNFELN